MKTLRGLLNTIEAHQGDDLPRDELILGISVLFSLWALTTHSLHQSVMILHDAAPLAEDAIKAHLAVLELAQIVEGLPLTEGVNVLTRFADNVKKIKEAHNEK